MSSRFLAASSNYPPGAESISEMRRREEPTNLIEKSAGFNRCLADMRRIESRFRKRGRGMAEARAAEKKIKPQQKESVRPLISAGRIQKRIRALAKEIRKDFPGERLHLVSVLKGGVFFLTDLARSIPGEVSFDFIAVSSYGQNTHSSGQVRLTRDLDSSIEGRTVIVVEDILDTGMTLQYLLRLFHQRKPKHLRVAVCWTSRSAASPRCARITSDSRSPTNSSLATAWIIQSATAICRMLES